MAKRKPSGIGLYRTPTPAEVDEAFRKDTARINATYQPGVDHAHPTYMVHMAVRAAKAMLPEVVKRGGLEEIAAVVNFGVLMLEAGALLERQGWDTAMHPVHPTGN